MTDALIACSLAIYIAFVLPSVQDQYRGGSHYKLDEFETRRGGQRYEESASGGR